MRLGYGCFFNGCFIFVENYYGFTGTAIVLFAFFTLYYILVMLCYKLDSYQSVSYYYIDTVVNLPIFMKFMSGQFTHEGMSLVN